MLDKARDYDLSSLRECVGGGEPLLPAIFYEWKEITGVEMINGLGISELLHTFYLPAAMKLSRAQSERRCPVSKCVS